MYARVAIFCSNAVIFPQDTRLTKAKNTASKTNPTLTLNESFGSIPHTLMFWQGGLDEEQGARV